MVTNTSTHLHHRPRVLQPQQVSANVSRVCGQLGVAVQLHFLHVNHAFASTHATRGTIAGLTSIAATALAILTRIAGTVSRHTVQHGARLAG